MRRSQRRARRRTLCRDGLVRLPNFAYRTGVSYQSMEGAGSVACCGHDSRRTDPGGRRVQQGSWRRGTDRRAIPGAAMSGLEFLFEQSLEPTQGEIAPGGCVLVSGSWWHVADVGEAEVSPVRVVLPVLGHPVGCLSWQARDVREECIKQDPGVGQDAIWC
jgi:hypothetical protein